MKEPVAYTPRRTCDVCGRTEGAEAAVVYHWNLRLDGNHLIEKTTSRGIDLCQEHASDKGQIDHHQLLCDLQAVGRKQVRQRSAILTEDDLK